MRTNRTFATLVSAVSLSLFGIGTGHCDEQQLNADAIISKAQIEALTEYYKDTFLMRQTLLRTIRTVDSKSSDASKEAELKLGYLNEEIAETEALIKKAVSSFNSEIAKQ